MSAYYFDFDQVYSFVIFYCLFEMLKSEENEKICPIEVYVV